jgi:lipopolysaccharide transport system permease protein
VFLAALELDEVFDFALRARAETTHLVGDALGRTGLVEEVADAEIERLQDAQQGVQTDFVLPLLHARQIRLVDADALGELHLSQLSLATKLSDLTSDELNLNWRTCGHFRALLCYRDNAAAQICAHGVGKSSQEAATISNRLYLLRELVKRDLASRFAGSTLGRAWAIIQPLCLIAVFWFVFSALIPMRFPGETTSYIHFLVAGLIPWLAITEGLSRSATAITDNGSMVRRMSFRTELLVVVPNAAAIVLELVALAIAFVFAVINVGFSKLLWVLPVALALQFGLMLGIGWIVAVLQVFFHDVAQILGFALTILFYLSPILYPPSPRFALLFEWNPLTPLVGLFRSAMLAAPLPSASSIVFLLAVVGGVVALGLLVFRRAEATLADYV